MATSALSTSNQRAEVNAAAADTDSVVAITAAVEETVEVTQHVTIVESRGTWRLATERRIPARQQSGTNRRRRWPEKRWTSR